MNRYFAFGALIAAPGPTLAVLLIIGTLLAVPVHLLYGFMDDLIGPRAGITAYAIIGTATAVLFGFRRATRKKDES